MFKAYVITHLSLVGNVREVILGKNAQILIALFYCKSDIENPQRAVRTFKSASSVTFAKGAIRKYKGHIWLGGHVNVLKKYTWYVPSRSCQTEVDTLPAPDKHEA